MSLNHQIITFSNNIKYFVLSELLEDNKVYYLIMNIENEQDIKIVEKEEKDNKIILNEIKDELKENLSLKFKESLEKEQKMYQ